MTRDELRTRIGIPTRVIALLLGIASGWTGASAFASDWSQFRGPSRDGRSDETGLLREWPEEGLKPLWVVTGLGKGYSSAAVAGGTIYVTGMQETNAQGNLFAFDLNGTLKWKTGYGLEWDGMYPGTRATPTVDGDRTYLLSGIGHLLCFDAETGSVHWSNDVMTTFGGELTVGGISESVLIHGNKVICTPGGTNACVVALDKTTGETIWTTEGFSERSAYCSPILVEHGAQEWLITITEKHIIGLDPETGSVVWKHPQDPDAENPNHSVSPVYGHGFVYATSGHGSGGRCLELSRNGQLAMPRWKDEILNTNHSGLVLISGYIYGASSKGKWICLAVKDGETMYEVDGIGVGSVVYADGMLYCYGESGDVALVQATPKGHKYAGRFEITEGDGEHWAHPSRAGGRLYIRHGDALMAFNLRP